MTEEVSFGFGQFYNNVNGVADSFAKFWGFMASEFKQYDTVLGYELINEPFAGDLYQAFSILLPGLAGSLNLAPLYEKAATEIRKVDTETIIFYEPVTWGYFAPFAHNPILDQVLVDGMNTFNLWTLEKAITEVCGPMETMNLTKVRSKLEKKDRTVKTAGFFLLSLPAYAYRCGSGKPLRDFRPIFLSNFDLTLIHKL